MKAYRVRNDEVCVLTLHLKRKWWEQIRDGVKTVELRRANDYWRRRLIGRHYDKVHLLMGYPKRGEKSRTLKRKWRSVSIASVLHEEFGALPVEVFAIDVGEEIEANERTLIPANRH